MQDAIDKIVLCASSIVRACVPVHVGLPHGGMFKHDEMNPHQRDSYLDYTAPNSSAEVAFHGCHLFRVPDHDSREVSRNPSVALLATR